MKRSIPLPTLQEEDRPERHENSEDKCEFVVEEMGHLGIRDKICLSFEA